MSLINEALKKAQKQRTGESPSLSSMPSIGGERASQIARRGGQPGFNDLLIRVGLGAGVLVILLVGGILLFRGKGGETAPAAPVNVAASAPTTPAASAPAVAVPVPAPVAVVAAPAPTTPPPAASTANTFVVPNVTASAPGTPPATAPVLTELPKPEPAPPVVVQAATPVVELPKPEPVKPAVPGKLEPRAINYIEGIRVAGIRASGIDGRDSKVLMNDRVYRMGDMVEHELGLKLVGITSASLTFEDERGAKYTRSF